MLFRASHHSASLEVELARRNIPFVKFGGLKFLEAAHIKDVLAVLRWAQNIRDRVAGFRVAQLLPGIGPTWAARLVDRIAECIDPIGALNGFRPPAPTAEHWQEFEATIGTLRRNATGWPAELDLVCRWYRPHLERIHEDATLREADLVQLTQIALTYPSRERFLTELTLDPPDATSDEAGVPLLDEDYLILSTIHSAKGQEWASVFAMTRAKDQLHLILPQRFFTHSQRSTGDRHVYAQRTRFIPNSVLDHFESCSWPPPKSVSEEDRRMRRPVDVRANALRMWG